MVAEVAYERSTQDIGNILLMEHVNFLVPDQQMAINFYISALGLTRDPYMMVGKDNLWANAGKQQFHLPTRGQQFCEDMSVLKYRIWIPSNIVWTRLNLCSKEPNTSTPLKARS